MKKAKCWIWGSIFEIFEFLLVLTFSACNVSSPKIKVFCLFSHIMQFVGVEKLTLQYNKVDFSTIYECCTKLPWNWRFLKLTRVWPPDLSSVPRDRCNTYVLRSTHMGMNRNSWLSNGLFYANILDVYFQNPISTYFLIWHKL